MPKLTETTNDMLHKRGPGRPKNPQPTGNGGLHITAPHEPLTGEPFQVQMPNQFSGLNMLTQHPPMGTMSPTTAIPQVMPAAQVQPLKIALIGTAPSSRMLAPYSDPSWKIWSCSPGNMGIVPRYDAWFEIHASLLWPENKHYGVPYIDFLSKLTCPVYMQDKRYCQNATPLPMQELVEEFGPYYFTSSFSWMIAMAMKAGAKEIALYGIDMASRDEYILQRPGIYYFFMEAKKRGIKVFAPYESDIMQPPGLYGYSEDTPFGRKGIVRGQELKDRLTGMRQQRDSLIQNITYLEGAVEDNDYWSSIHGGVQNNPAPDPVLSKLQGESKNG